MATKIQPTSLARGRGVSVDNVAAKISVTNKEMKGLLIGTALAANTTGGTYSPLVRTRVYSADQVGSLAGFGSAIHRAAMKFFRGNGSKTQVHVVIQEEELAAVRAAGSIAVTHEPTANGTWHVYVDGDHYPIPCTADLTITTLGDAVEEAINANPDAPVVALNAAGTVGLTSKSLGTSGNDISIATNQRDGEETPAGVTATLTPMAAGATDPDVQDALDVLGLGDLSNYNADTHFVVCYGRLDTDTMDALSEYNGTANEVEGCYLDTVGRPFTAWWGDMDCGTNGLDALTTIGDDSRELDKTNIMVPRPNSPTNPTDLAAEAAGYNAALAQYRPEEPMGGKILAGIEPGPLALLAAATGDWATEYENRDLAVKNGISTTMVENNVVKMSDLVTFYHPTVISAYSNCYRLVNNVWKVANMVKAWRDLLTSSIFDGITIVADIRRVTSQVDRQKVMDRDSIWSFVVQMVTEFEKHAWIYSAADTLDLMKDHLDEYIVLREGGLGWDVVQPTFLSGSGEIFTIQIKVDANSAR